MNAPCTIKEIKRNIPTYPVGEKEKNPMFLEKRVYQGSSGRVYPHPVVDRISSEKQMQEYTIIVLENQYLLVEIMPEFAGRISRAVDKTNGYDFVYHNQVIKPALVALTGPWVSGGIEFNWPQHHRPNTFGPVEYRLDDSKEDRVTLWVSEIDRMYGTKVTTGFTLRQNNAYIEISSTMYNPTSEPQTFLWWANPAVAVHDDTQSIFPPDVHAVMDHGKRAVSKFPIATGEYYKYDYSEGVDISRYKNIPVPTSYMAYHSDYDFVGGYDYKANAGILHVADHHVSPGKKQWTWGHGDFGRAWDRNLTDEDGPYIELMTGVFTDNQPDFTWLQPYEEKNFTQYFMPYKEIGEVKTASKDIVVGLDQTDGSLTLRAYGTSSLDVTLRLSYKEDLLLEETVTISPSHVFTHTLAFTKEEAFLHLQVFDNSGRELLSYKGSKEEIIETPDPAKAIGLPASLKDAEALYLAGTHLEQYRHATYEPDAYYLEGLKRSPDDLRLNNAYGNLLLRRGLFAESQTYFERAVKTATRHSPNPYDGECFYNLGKAFHYQGNLDNAFDSYFKSTWSDAWKSKGFLKLAQISLLKKDYEKAVDYATQSLYSNYLNFKARNILTIIPRLLGRTEGVQRAEETLTLDPMDYVAHYELALGTSADSALSLLGGNPHNYIFLAESYSELGLFDTAESILSHYLQRTSEPYPMVFYYLATYQKMQGLDATKTLASASKADTAYCFPNSLADLRVLHTAIESNSKDARAYYYRGCYLYDKRRHEEAATDWETSHMLDDTFPTASRNLSLFYANKKHDWSSAREHLETAFHLDEGDARVFYELITLYRHIGLPMEELLALLDEHQSLVLQRDDLIVEYLAVLNYVGRHRDALDLLSRHHFHPWEGGEGKVPTQFIEAHIGLAKEALDKKDAQTAIQHLESALVYPHNFGEGKLVGNKDNNIYYYLGLAYAQVDEEKSKTAFEKASIGGSEPTSAIYYYDQPPHMIYYKGLALLALGKSREAHSCFYKLINYGENNLKKKQMMDYFAVSMPDFIVFESDLDRNNQIHCYYMMALGQMGVGHKENALHFVDEVLALDPHHYGAHTLRQELTHQ